MIRLSWHPQYNYPYVFVLGALLPLAFAPWSWWFLALILPALWLQAAIHATPRQALGLGLCFGLGWFGFGAWWVYVSIHTFGQAPPLLAGLGTALFILILSLFPAGMLYLTHKLFSQPNLRLSAFPAALTVFEWLRSYAILGGFPWLLLPHSQVNGPLTGFIPVFGEWGMEFVLGMLISLITACLLYKALRLRMLAFMVVIGLVSFGLTQIEWTKPYRALHTVLVQGGIPQTVKWEPGSLHLSLDRYVALTAPYWGTDLIIWPESAIPTFPEDIPEFLTELSHHAHKKHSVLLTGIPWQNAHGQYFNAVTTFGQTHSQLYRKRHLVPFGEYTPLESIMAGLLTWLHIPMSNFSAGPAEQPPISIEEITIQPLICYEISYPELMDGKGPPHLLVTLVNDAWFGNTFAAAQHLQIGQFRAAATGRPLAFVTNDGITAIVNPQGQISAQLPRFAPGVLDQTIMTTRGLTPASSIPSLLYFILALCSLILLRWGHRTSP